MKTVQYLGFTWTATKIAPARELGDDAIFAAMVKEGMLSTTVVRQLAMQIEARMVYGLGMLHILIVKKDDRTPKVKLTFEMRGTRVDLEDAEAALFDLADLHWIAKRVNVNDFDNLWAQAGGD